MPVTTDLPTAADSALTLYGSELRRLRTERGLTQDQLAVAISYSTTLIGMVENARRNPNPDFTHRCDDVLRTGGALNRLLPLIAREAYPSWFRPFVDMEAEALSIQEFEVQVVTGLLQTEDYARAILNSWPPRTAEDIERRLVARMERQQILHRDDPPLLSFVLDESVLRRPMCEPRLMAAQLAHLIAAAELPHVQLQVLPFDRAAKAPTDGSYVVLELPKKDRYIYVEGPGSGRLIPEQDLVDRFAQAFARAQCQALAVEDSIGLIARLKRDLYEHP